MDTIQDIQKQSWEQAVTLNYLWAYEIRKEIAEGRKYIAREIRNRRKAERLARVLSALAGEVE